MSGKLAGGRPALEDRPLAAGDDDLGIRGLLHDLGHQMMTLSLLAESVRDDAAVSAGCRRRLELLVHETFRAMDMLGDYRPGETLSAGTAAAGHTDVRRMAGELAQLAGLAYDTAVTLRPGGPAVLRISSTSLWRVLANLVDNAVRAAGPGGIVEIAVDQELDTVLEITDNGPGFGAGRDAAGLGLSVVRQLLEATGGRLEVSPASGGGTCARIVFGLEREYLLTPACAGPWH